MMLGGGFLKQMAETVKQNRDLLKKEKRKPFEKREPSAKGQVMPVENKKLSEAERADLLSKVKDENRKDRIRAYRILIISILLTGLIVIIFMSTIGEQLRDFLD
jgi:hypothetical protein